MLTIQELAKLDIKRYSGSIKMAHRLFKEGKIDQLKRDQLVLKYQSKKDAIQSLMSKFYKV